MLYRLFTRMAVRGQSASSWPRLLGSRLRAVLCYRETVRWLIVVRVLLLVLMLGLAVAWLTGTVEDVSGPLLLACPLVIFTYRA
jgi:hypothetical protein